MHVHALRVRNFRRLKDVRIDLAADISIFVGANNSGKTSASQVLQLFCSGSRERFSIHDFSAECWSAINDYGNQVESAVFSKISIDLWFHVDSPDLHRVIDLLPSLRWEGTLVGLRVEFVAIDQTDLRTAFHAARDRAIANQPAEGNGRANYQPMPRTMCDYLADNLRRDFELRYYVLDRGRFDASLVEADGYAPLLITSENGRSGKDVLNSLLRVDFLSAQRHLSDNAGGARTEDLSRCLSRFYDRNLEKRGEDYDALRALTEAEGMLNEHLARVFEPTLRRLGDLGYPGVANPRLLIKSTLNPATIMSSHDGARVHYALDEVEAGIESPTLPDRYNGLGFKNLIYMVVELLDLHSQWTDVDENRPPLHLVFIEEPEAHLHAQLQQVFIRKILDILAIEGEDHVHYRSQVVVTTHSPHILYERGFRPIRYFRRSRTAVSQYSEVLNLSAYYDQTENPTRDFLERYLKLTHCDLFFADAAILVEGNVERLLLPQMIENVAPRLKSACLSILEIGGAFGHRFRSLIEFLGITTLIITDIDSVVGGETPLAVDEAAETDEPPDADDAGVGAGKACLVNTPDAVTSNQTLIQWLPARTTIVDLLAATEQLCIQLPTDATRARVLVTYQTLVAVTWNGVTADLAGRTLEEAFAFENLKWCQHLDRAELKLRIPANSGKTLEQLVERLHKRIKGTSFHKTDFALALLAQDPTTWKVPTYIAKGLRWLEEIVTPVPPQHAPQPGSENVA